MNQSKKKRSANSSRSATRPRRRWLGRAWRLFLLCFGFSAGFAGPWLLWLDHQVTAEFEGRKWDLPSRVYARPLSLYSGREMTPQALVSELEAAGYLVGDPGQRPGLYRRSGSRFEIHRRPFRFDDGTEPAQVIRVDLAGGVVTTLSDGQGTALDLVRMDPAEIASIFPLHEEDRTLMSIDTAPELLVTGLQAVEDRNFKHHPGVDLRGVARALLANIRAGGTVQGGSTLTQQLVKNYYLSGEQTLQRKFNEAAMALLLEWHYDKQEILEAYLNEVHLGQQGSHGIHGFARASEFYFGMPVEEIRPHQAALLVGLVRGASLYNPRRHPQRARERRDHVLDVFAQTGLLTAEQAAAWKTRPLDVTEKPGAGRNRFPAFVDLVRRQLRRDYREDDLRNEGLRIFTTLAPSEQLQAEQSVVEGMRELAQRGLPAGLQAALVLADVASGEVRAVVGDREPGRRGFNRALDARRQIGSVIKPVIYLVALEHQNDFSLLTHIDDVPLSLREPDGSIWSPKNYDGQSHGSVTLLEALTQSLNLATVHVGLQLGVPNVIARLSMLGVETEVPALPSTLLGALELTPLEVTQIYQSLAAGGYTVPLRAVTAVQTAEGATLNRYPLRLVPLERRDAVAVLNYALTEVVRSGTAKALPGLLGSDAAIAGKTGTTNEQRDSWFVGYTRDKVAVTWVGDDANQPAGVTGSNAAMRVWARLFRDLPLQPVDKDMPEGAYWTWVEPGLAALSDPSCPGAVQLPFVEGSEPVSESPCLARVEKRNRKPFWRKWFERN